MQVRRLLDNTQPDLVLPLKSMRSVRTINYDTADDKIYWIMDSDKYRAIKRSTVDGSRVCTTPAIYFDFLVLTFFWFLHSVYYMIF